VPSKALSSLMPSACRWLVSAYV